MTPEQAREAIHLWANGKTVAQIAGKLELPADEVGMLVAEETYAAVRAVLHGRLRAGGYM